MTSCRRTSSKRWTSRRGLRSPRWSRRQQRHLRGLLVHGIPRRCQRHGVPPKRERKLARVRAGTAHAGLVFDGDDCMGLVPVRGARRGSEDQESRRIRSEPDDVAGLGPITSTSWVRGIGARVLPLRRWRARSISSRVFGGGSVEGYPEDAASVPTSFLYHGALSISQRHLPGRRSEHVCALSSRISRRRCRLASLRS